MKLLAAFFLIIPPNQTESCKNQFTTQQLIDRLNKININSPLGGFNPSFMSFTFKGTRKFQRMVPTVNGTRSTQDIFKSLSSTSTIVEAPLLPSSSTNGPCVSADQSGFISLCEACPVTTFLGFNVIPHYINEVICGSSNPCSKIGLCKNAVLTQQFFLKTGRCDDDDFDELEEFSQEIRVCCQCMLPQENF